jgi:hypothetical protein
VIQVYLKMKISLNSSIDVARLVGDLNASPTRATNLKYKTYYFLSLLTDTNDNYRLNESRNGFHKLCSSELKKVLGNKDFYLIRELLLNSEDPIIEVDSSWHNPKGKNSSAFCQGYRIKPKYNSGEVEYKTLPLKFSKTVIKSAFKQQIMTDSTPDYKFLLDQIERNTLSFDPSVYNYVNNFGQQLLQRVQNFNEYQLLLIHNLIGRWLYFIQQIENGKAWSKVSDKNYRLNSSITNLPRLLRPFLLCNGEQLKCVDISSCQPYILSSIMRSKFYQENDVGYNLKTIYPELYKELVDKRSIDTSITYSINNNIQYYTSHTGYTTNTYSNISNSSSFMWCNFFTTSELDSINRYTQSPFYMDFYTHILDKYYTYTNTLVKAVNKDDREKLKNTMMFVLFDDNQNHRNNNQQIQIFQTVFPGVEKWLNQIHKLIGKQRFSYLLQRSESYLLLRVICREFNTIYPNAPLLTIHDGVFTTDGYVRKLNLFVLRRLNELTGVLAGCKIKASQIDPNPQIKDVEKEWSKIKAIETEEKYNKNCNGVFTSNIKRGSDFLANFSGIFILILTLN